MERNKLIAIIAGTLIIGSLIGWFIKPSTDEKVEHAHELVGENEIWTCSMHPQIRRNEPGDCPICGMTLIPLESGQEGNSANYQMSEDAMKLANVTTVMVGSGSANKSVTLNGKIAVDEANSYSQSTHIPGRIEKLSVNTTGEQVKRGQTLAVIYSPELVTAQQELLQAAAIKGSQPELFEAAKEKLRNWKIGNSQIDRILANGKTTDRFPISADVNGVVTEKMVELGDYVERGMPIYQISDLSKIWVEFDLYEGDLNWVKVGDEVSFTINSFPGEDFEGKISFIDPLLGNESRVAAARVELSNKDGKLKPGMFVSGTVKNAVKSQEKNQIVIPESSVLWTGERSIVYVKENEGFTLREITLGPSLGDSYIVQNGLENGEEIVSNGTFTVDAAVQLSGGRSMMSPDEKMDMNTTNNNFSEKDKENLGKVLQSYLKLKNALVEDNLSTAKTEIANMNTALAKVNSEEKTTENTVKNLKTVTSHLSQTKDLKAIRDNFESVSKLMIQVVKSAKIESERLYVLHCPRTNNNKGADWISLSAEVKNPYYGQAMLNCGEVTSEIN